MGLHRVAGPRYDPGVSTWTTTRIRERIDWAADLSTILLTEPKLEFVPGQFVNLGLDVGGQRIRRSYSLASAPHAAPEFYVTKVPGGQLTPSLFDLKVGDALQIDTAPQGFFTLGWVPEWGVELWLVATGTGLGPFVSMWRSGELGRFERIIIVHGVRARQQFGYSEELVKLTEEDQRFRVVKLVTRDVSGDEVLPCRITTALVNGTLEDAAGTRIDVGRSHFMLCGNPEMIKEMTGLLQERGMRKNRRREPGHITTEKYW